MPKRTNRASREISLLLRILDQAFDHTAWHGTTLGGSLRGLTAREAAWRPAPARHNIWEIVLHAAYWKYAVRRRLLGTKSGSFPRLLRNTVARLPAGRLRVKGGRRRWMNSEMIHGIAAHDLYHAGQIQLLKRLHKSRASG